VFYSGTEGDINVLVMELLGEDLEELTKTCGGKLPLKTVLIIAEQCITRIRQIHKRLLIHRDIKPENIAIGLGKRSNTIYILDFGLSRQYMNPNTKQHIPFKEGKQLIGSIRYSSLNTHQGIEQSRRDDLESLGFIFVYLLKGKLPWQGLPVKDKAERFKMVKKVMGRTSIEELTKNLPSI